MKSFTYVREDNVSKKEDCSYEISYYRLTVISKTRLCNSKLADELFEYFKIDMLEWRLNKLRRVYKCLETKIENQGNIATVTITRRPWFKKWKNCLHRIFYGGNNFFEFIKKGLHFIILWYNIVHNK